MLVIYLGEQAMLVFIEVFIEKTKTWEIDGRAALIICRHLLEGRFAGITPTESDYIFEASSMIAFSVFFARMNCIFEDIKNAHPELAPLRIRFAIEQTDDNDCLCNEFFSISKN
jgi:hypothetical protein